MSRALKSTGKRAALLARVSSQPQGKTDRVGIPVQLEAVCSFQLRRLYG